MKPQLPLRRMRSQAGGSSVNHLTEEFQRLNGEVDELQRRAQSPPQEISKQNAWATTVKDDSLKLVAKLDDLAADAMDAAAANIPGSIDVYSKVNVALESCATCHKLTEIALETWSGEQTFEVCKESELGSYSDKAEVIDKGRASSVAKAAEELNAGAISCAKGYCLVYSVNREAYFLLYRSDKKEECFELFNMEEKEVWNWRTNAGREHGDDGYHFGDLTRTAVKHAATFTKEWAGREKTRDGYEFGDLFLKKCATCCCGSAASDAEIAEIAKKLQADRDKAHELLEKNVMILELRQKDIERKQGMASNAKAPINGIYARKYRKGLDELEESMKAVPDIDPVFIRRTQEHGDFKKIKDSIQSILQLAQQCEADAKAGGG